MLGINSEAVTSRHGSIAVRRWAAGLRGHRCPQGVFTESLSHCITAEASKCVDQGKEMRTRKLHGARGGKKKTFR